MERFGLSRAEVEALKRGRDDELLRLGLDPGVVSPDVRVPAPLPAWLLRNAKRLAPAALVAATLVAWPSTAGAAPVNSARVNGGRATIDPKAVVGAVPASAPAGKGINRAIDAIYEAHAD